MSNIVCSDIIVHPAHAEKQLLLDFKAGMESSGGDVTGDLATWSADTDMSNWDGVFLTADGNVQRL